LNIITSAKIESTTFNTLTKLYTIKFSAPSSSGIIIKATAKHLVQATGFGWHKPYLPPFPNSSLYTGISIHSAQFTNAKALEDQGVKVIFYFLFLFLFLFFPPLPFLFFFFSPINNSSL
jgi:cation diffusion facilitator CzcD-associated flavoprotein CzcO